MLVAVMKRSGKSVDSLIFAIMLCTVILSSVMSNVAACVIFMSASMEFLKIYDTDAEKRRTGRTFMIALPIAAMTGSMYTPASSSLNMIVLSQLESIAGLEIQFIKWMAMGIPMVVFIFPIAAFFVLKFNKPAPVSKEKLDAYMLKLQNETGEKWSFKEKYVCVVVLAVLVAWILGSWFPFFQITAVAILGVFFFFIPGLEIFDWKEVESNISWSAILLVASFISMGNAFISTGAAKWLAGLIVPSSLNAPVFVIALIIGLIVFAMLVIIPVAPALIPIFSVPLISLATAAGISPYITMMCLAFTVGNCYLLPFDTVPVITYMTGYYTKRELARTAIFIQLYICVIVALWVPFITGFLGF